ncbi:MAG: efflux RND transporter permease subunit [Blautia sp.]|jgi:multidrug efflux pump subunit AcrB
MLSKYSVKKPYTVVVAVVLILILGFVSFTKMNTDLLPSMNLPYAVVMTTYSGASPETVETVVTKPIEQSMATVSDIENVSSSSRENISLVILEFAETANMDSVTIEMREKLDQIGAYWDDSVAKPIIMKLNPDMMPVMISAVEVDGLSATEVTDYVSKHVEPEVESIAGVASVSTTGTITESVEVLIRQEKVEAANQKVMEALDKSFEEKEADLKDAQEEIDSGKAELQDGKVELESGKDEMVSQIGQGESKLNESQAEIIKGEAELDMQLAQLESKETELAQSKEQLAKGKQQAQDGITKLKETQEGLHTLQQAMEMLDGKADELAEGLNAAQQGLQAVEDQLAALELNPEDPAYEPAKAALEQQKAELMVQIETMEKAQAELTAQKEALESQLSQVLQALGKEDAAEADAYLTEQISTLEGTLQELEENEQKLLAGEQQLADGKAQIESARAQIQSGKVQVSEALSSLSTQKILASIEMSTAQAKLDAGETSLESAQKQLDEGKDQLEEAKEKAKDQTNLSSLISADLVKGILAGENFSMPAGYVTEDGVDYLVRVGDKLEDTGDLEDLVILDLDMDGLEPIRLSDVADVTRVDNSDEVYAKLNGKPGVMLTIEKQTGYSTGEVTDRILDRFAEIEKENDGLHVSVLMNQGIYIDLVVNSVLSNMVMGAILAILILLFFLKDIRPTFVIACSIPISVVATFVLMYFSGITLNIISLSGLALGIGMLVDNSIVVIENIYRMRKEGVPARKAAVDGARQVAGAIASSTLTTVCVFAPIVFTEGITRQLFVDMGLTIAYSLLSSLVVALTLVPMMSAGMLKKAQAKKTPLLDRIQNAYGRGIALALRFKPVVLLLAIILLIGSAYLAVSKGSAFMPEMESTQATITLTMDKGTPLTKTAKCADEVVERIQNLEDIESIGAMAGGSSMGAMLGGGTKDTTSVSMYLLLKEDKKLSGEELQAEILRRTKDLPGELEVNTQSMDMSALGGTGIQMQIKGKELDTLQQIAKEVAEKIAKVEGTVNVEDGLEDTDQEFRIAVNKAKAMEHGLTVAQVFQEINKRLTEASSATTLSTPDKDYSIYVRTEKDEKLSRKDIKNLTLEVTDKEGEKKNIKVSEIADFKDAVSPQAINRDAQSRYMNVTAQIEDGYNIGLVSQAVEKVLKDYQLPSGYTLEMKGEDETIGEAMEQLYLMLVLALVFMYLIMVAQFQSLLSPFIIMFTIPLAFTGGFIGLLVGNMEVSVIAMIGFIMLSGIIVNNGIVLVDYTNQLRKEGYGKKEALIQAGKDRLRPIVMTALTTILGLSTMAAGMGMGSDMVQPMAVVTIGGLLYGTLLTLFVVPCIYDLLNRKEYKRDELRLEDVENEEGNEP